MEEGNCYAISLLLCFFFVTALYTCGRCLNFDEKRVCANNVIVIVLGFIRTSAYISL